MDEDREVDSIKLVFDGSIKEHFLKPKSTNNDNKEGSSNEGPSPRFSVAI